jgi:hypothetical protein
MEPNTNLGPQVQKIDEWAADAQNHVQNHEKYRAMRNLAIQLENELSNLREEFQISPYKDCEGKTITDLDIILDVVSNAKYVVSKLPSGEWKTGLGYFKNGKFHLTVETTTPDCGRRYRIIGKATPETLQLIEA